MTDKEKIKEIEDLVSNRSSLLQNELSTEIQKEDSNEVLVEVLSGQIEVLDQIYNEITIIKNS